MLSSPLQWPLLVAGIAACVVITWSGLRAARVSDARVLLQVNNLAARVLIVALSGLVLIDFAAIYVIGRTEMIGLRFILGMFVWMLMIVLPVALRTKRIRRERGWPIPWDAPNAVEHDDRC
jgi:hypothetical protein